MDPDGLRACRSVGRFRRPIAGGLSLDAVTMRLPSGLKAAHITVPMADERTIVGGSVPNPHAQ